MADAQENAQPGQVYQEQIKGKVGTGDTARDATMHNFWRVIEVDGEGVHMELLDMNDLPSGYRETVSPSDLITRFMLVEGFKPTNVSPKAAKAEQIASRGERHLADQEYYSAEFEFSNAIKLDQMNVRANYGLGQTYMALGEEEKAKEVFSKLSENERILEPKHAHIFNDFGIQLRKLGMYAEAVRHYQKALLVAPSDENLWFNVGRALVEGGQIRAGVGALRKALSLNPGFEVAAKYIESLERKLAQSRSQGAGS